MSHRPPPSVRWHGEIDHKSTVVTTRRPSWFRPSSHRSLDCLFSGSFSIDCRPRSLHFTPDRLSHNIGQGSSSMESTRRHAFPLICDRFFFSMKVGHRSSKTLTIEKRPSCYLFPLIRATFPILAVYLDVLYRAGPS